MLKITGYFEKKIHQYHYTIFTFRKIYHQNIKEVNLMLGYLHDDIKLRTLFSKKDGLGKHR
jgi:hypothetical protein